MRTRHEVEAAEGSGFATVLWTIPLLLLAFGGYIKGSRYIAFLPLDITVAAAALVALQILYRLQQRGARPPRAVVPLMLLLVTFLLGTIPVGLSSNTYAPTKTIQALAIVPLCILGGVYLLQGDRIRRAWVGVNAVYGFAVVLIAVVDPSSVNERLAIEGGNTIAAGRAAGAAMVIFALGAMLAPRRRLLLALAAAFTGVATIATASRGPLLAAILSVLCAAALAPRRGAAQRITLLAVSGAGLVTFVLPQLVLADRLTNLNDQSSEVRRHLWARSMDLIAERPFGVGWGRFYENIGVTLLDSGYTQYSHNLFLEVGLEAGWLALLTVILVVGSALRAQRARAMTTVESILLGLLLFHLINSLVSGDLGGNRGVWVAIGAAVVPVVPLLKSRRPEFGHERHRHPEAQETQAVSAQRSAPLGDSSQDESKEDRVQHNLDGRVSPNGRNDAAT